MLYEMKCTNDQCVLKYEEQIKIAEYEANGAKCPQCGAPAEREVRTNPGHFRHASWAQWRMGHGY